MNINNIHTLRTHDQPWTSCYKKRYLDSTLLWYMSSTSNSVQTFTICHIYYDEWKYIAQKYIYAIEIIENTWLFSQHPRSYYIIDNFIRRLVNWIQKWWNLTNIIWLYSWIKPPHIHHQLIKLWSAANFVFYDYTLYMDYTHTCMHACIHACTHMHTHNI